MKKHRILILMHESDERPGYGPFGIDVLAKYWEADGHRVLRAYGPRQFIPADIVIVHVDLSIVPDEYLNFAKQYPIAINGQLRDVRKSAFSKQLIRSKDAWEGPVIVKTDRNYGGMPEKVRQHPGAFDKALRAISRHVWGIRGMYRVYDHAGLVPRGMFHNPDYVVERFLPERDNDGNFCLRTSIFMGDRTTTLLLRSRDPIVTATSAHSVENVDEHPALRDMRRELRIDYGKLDYVMHGDEATLLDVNKTVGVSPPALEVTGLEGLRRYRAEGLYAFLSNDR